MQSDLIEFAVANYAAASFPKQNILYGIWNVGNAYAERVMIHELGLLADCWPDGLAQTAC